MSETGTIGGGNLPEILQQPRDESALACKVAVADPSQVRLAPRRGEIVLEPGTEGVDVVITTARICRHRDQARAAGLALAAAWASTANAFVLVTARSASVLRSIGLFAAFKPEMSCP